MRASAPLPLMLMLLLLKGASVPAATAADTGLAAPKPPEAAAAGSNRQGRTCFGLSCWLSRLASLFVPGPPGPAAHQAILVVPQQPQEHVIRPVVEVTIPCTGPNCQITAPCLYGDCSSGSCQGHHECGVGVCLASRCVHCYLDKHCTGGFCRAGSCHAPLPVGGRCSRGSHCKSGFCGKRGVCVACQHSSDCPGGVGCTTHGLCSGPFPPTCLLHGCPPGYQCQGGHCQPVPPPSCAAVLCPEGSICKDGVCLPGLPVPPPSCKTDSECSPTHYCRAHGGGCHPKHTSKRFCSSNNQCQSEKCVRSPVLAGRTGRSQKAPLALPFSSRCQ